MFVVSYGSPTPSTWCPSVRKYMRLTLKIVPIGFAKDATYGIADGGTTGTKAIDKPKG